MRGMTGPARIAVVALLAIAVAAGMACKDKDDDSSAAGARPDPVDLVNRAAKEVEGLKSFSFVLEHENGGSPIVLGLTMKTARGEVVKPDRLRADVEAVAPAFGNSNVNVKVVAVGDDARVTNPFNPRQFVKLPGANPLADIFDPAAGTSAVLRAVKNPRIVGEETIDGTKVWKVEGEVDGGELGSITALAEKGHVVKGTAWVGQDRPLVYRVRLDGPLGSKDDADIVRKVELSRFDEPVTIELP